MAEGVVVDCSGKLPPEDRITRVEVPDGEVLEFDTTDADRAIRNRLLAESDWTQLPDVQMTMGQTERAAWSSYRQQLRDNPTGPWPDRPAV